MHVYIPVSLKMYVDSEVLGLPFHVRCLDDWGFAGGELFCVVCFCWKGFVVFFFFFFVWIQRGGESSLLLVRCKGLWDCIVVQSVLAAVGRKTKSTKIPTRKAHAGKEQRSTCKCGLCCSCGLTATCQPLISFTPSSFHKRLA